MLGDHYKPRDRRHGGWRRWRTRWRVLILSRRGPSVALCLVLALGALVLLGARALVRRYQTHQQELAWTVTPLTAEHTEQFTQALVGEIQRGVADAGSVRGVVLPLFDDIALLGFSLILELRRLGVTLPVEVPHCGDLDPKLQARMAAEDPLVRVYDICKLAVEATGASGAESEPRPLFCVDLAHCHAKFRSFDVKVLALVYSRFEEIMLMDADTLFFQSPMALWESQKYSDTGTLFFHDRISYESSYLAARVPLDGGGGSKLAALHHFLSGFDATPYRGLGVVARSEPNPQVPKRLGGLQFDFEPSAFLLRSHAWRMRSGHQMDSSLTLWNKTRQPRATAILASFIALNGLTPPPSYGDKELYWLACELAETAYAFSDFAVGAIGWNLIAASQGGATDAGASVRADNAVLCGDALQYFPTRAEMEEGPSAEPLYMNSDNILEWGKTARRLYRTEARLAGLYPGSFTELKLPQTCPFDVTAVSLDSKEMLVLTQRLELHDRVAGWREEVWAGWWR